jgi:hypothetical protein
VFGVVVASFLFLRKLLKIYKLITNNKKQKTQYNTLVVLPNSTVVFSFLNYIFIGKNVKNSKCLRKHEQVHIAQKHSWDLLWFEILKIVLWFNPMLYFYQKDMSVLHEYIADAILIKTKKTDYYNRLLNDYFQIENIAFVNQFYKQSLIKKRIIMMTKNKSKSWKTIKYMLIFPLLAGMWLISFQTNAQTVLVDAIPFRQIDEVPVFPGCEKISDKKAQFQCFSKKIQIFVSRKFNVDFAQTLGLAPGKKRIYTTFIINKEGNVSHVQVIAPHPALVEETKRVINLLPKIIPGKYKNEMVSVKYMLPIVFVVEGEENEVIETQEIDKESAVSFSLIEQVPIFPGCENAKDKAKCLSKNIQKQFSRDFNLDLMQSLNLPKGKKKIYTMFTIDKEGNIEKVKARAPHPELEAEAIRVVKMFPKMQPGKQKGNAISVKYSLPIMVEIK